MAMGVVGVLLLLVAVVVTVVAAVTSKDAPNGSGSQTVAVPNAVLPKLGEAAPVLAALASDAPKPSADALTSRLAPLLANPALGSGVKAEVRDVASGDVLVDQNAAAPATPASTAKLLTAVAALSTLGPDATITTTVV